MNGERSQVHVASWLGFALMWMVLLWSFPHVEMLLFSFFCLLIWLIRTTSILNFFKQLRWIAPVLLLIILIQLSLNQDGMRVLWQEQFSLSLSKWSVEFEYRLTLEAIILACKSALQYVMFLGIWHVFSTLLEAKRVFAFGARWFPHFMQMFYITMRLVPQLRQRAQAIQDVLETRGFQRTTGTFHMRQKIREQLPLMNALLEESLEGSWHRAEAMLLRGYSQSKRKRSFFVEDPWSWRDAIVWGSTIACLLSIWFYFFLIGFLIPLFLIAKKAGQTNES